MFTIPITSITITYIIIFSLWTAYLAKTNFFFTESTVDKIKN